MNNIDLGKFGENIAEKYLIKIGNKIIFKNYWHKMGEIDIIAREDSGILIFYEVKTLRVNNHTNAHFNPEDNLSSSKLKKIKRMADFFAGNYPEWILSNKGWRIDLLAIAIFEKRFVEIRHYRNL